LGVVYNHVVTFLASKTTKLRRTIFLLVCGAGLGLWGCDEHPQKPAQPKTNEFETGRFALQKMIPVARFWAPDAAPVTLASTVTSQTNGHDGKSGLWHATFASSGRRKSEPFMWSGMADAQSKVDHGIEDAYNPNNRAMQTWDLNFLKVDTDKALEVAQEHGGKALMEKDPQQPIIYLLDFDSGAGQLRWHVIYGDSESNAKLTILVDASTGRFLRKE
jgi:hypothetical protein